MLTRTGPARTNSGYRALKQSSDAYRPAEIENATPVSVTRTTPYLLFIVCVATLGPFQFGYHLGELNASQKVIVCKPDESQRASAATSLQLPQCFPMDISTWGLAQSGFTLGGLTGALLAGSFATSYGRKRAMQVLTIALLLGSLVEALSLSAFMLVLGRFFSGTGAGAATVVAPIFIAEVSPTERRGFFGACTQVMVNMGILISQLLGYFFSSPAHWRLILAFPAALSVITLGALLMLTETPKWLSASGMRFQAKESLLKLHAADAGISAELLTVDYTSDEATPLLGSPAVSQTGKCASISFVQVTSSSYYRRAVIAVVAVFVAQQATGINSVMMYSVSILGIILPTAATLVTTLVSLTNLVVSVISTPLPDKIGRKKCLLFSIAGMGTSSVLLAVSLSHGIASCTIAALFTFVCSFAIGLGPVPFLLPSELVKADAVGAVSAWGLAGSWLSTFCVAQFFPLLNSLMPKGQVYWVFAGIALVLGAFIAWQVPETKGKADPEEVWEQLLLPS